MANEEIYFPDDKIFNTISDILHKNGVEEDPAEAADKISGGEDSLITSVFVLARNFAKQKITQAEFITTLQIKTKVSPETAQNIFNDVKEKILPTAQKIAIGETIVEEKPAVNVQPIANAPARPSAQGPAIPARAKPIEKKPWPTISKPPEIESKEAPSIPKGPDTYREPIE
jgi:hypothetical protein